MKPIDHKRVSIALAKKALGWRLIRGSWKTGDPLLDLLYSNEGSWAPFKTWAAMGLLAEAVKNDYGYFFDILWDRDEEAWHARWHDGQKTYFYGWGLTAPEAVCIAVARAYAILPTPRRRQRPKSRQPTRRAPTRRLTS